jgi:hypothetical protein
MILPRENRLAWPRRAGKQFLISNYLTTLRRRLRRDRRDGEIVANGVGIVGCSSVSVPSVRQRPLTT